MPGYKDWIAEVDIKVDYYSAFMKAWIAFNAWYNFSGEIPTGTDKKCIEHISEHTNRFKSYVTNLIESDSTEGEAYRNSIAKLHESLLNAPITTQEYLGFSQSISFSQVAVKNTNNRHSFDYYGCTYECKRANGKTIVSVKQGRTPLFYYEQDEYSLDDLEQQSDFKALTENRRNSCKRCYKELKPYMVENVLDITENQNALKMGSYSFINDVDKVSRAIVILLYMLRCCLAHGDFVPDDASSNVYKYAYEVLVPPLKKLK